MRSIKADHVLPKTSGPSERQFDIQGKTLQDKSCFAFLSGMEQTKPHRTKGGTTAAAMDVVEALNSGTKELLAKQRSLATKGSPLQLIQNGLTQPAEGLPAVPEVQVLLRQTRTSQRRALWFTM